MANLSITMIPYIAKGAMSLVRAFFMVFLARLRLTTLVFMCFRLPFDGEIALCT